MPMPAREIIVHMARLHHKRRKDNDPPVLNPQAVAQKRKPNKVDYVIYRSMMELVQKENNFLEHTFTLPHFPPRHNFSITVGNIIL